LAKALTVSSIASMPPTTMVRVVASACWFCLLAIQPMASITVTSATMISAMRFSVIRLAIGYAISRPWHECPRAVMTAKNFYTFNILLEFESICIFTQAIVRAEEFHFDGFVATPGETSSRNRTLPR
jgi:hypothetical protein